MVGSLGEQLAEESQQMKEANSREKIWQLRKHHVFGRLCPQGPCCLCGWRERSRGTQRDARVRQQPHGQEVQLKGEGSSRRVARWPRGRQRLIKKELEKQTKVSVCI